MPKNSESLNRTLFDLLHSRGYDPTMLDTSGKEIPTPEEAEVFQFDFIKDGENYGKVTMSIDGAHKLIIYFNDKVADSEKENSESGDLSWYKLLNQLKRFAQSYQLSFELRNVDNLKHDMAKREYMKKKESVQEGYYPMGKKASYSDNVPNVKMVIQHSRQIEEGEQRYRNVERIFLENEQGERFLAPTTKPGIARVYARHIAEGGMPHDDRWNHIGSLCEEYQKMGAFVRATRNGQFNESTQRLVTEGANHYQKLRESLSKLAGHRGYNAYFESYTPALMEDEGSIDLSEMFMSSSLDPRIESVMPILAKLSKNITEMSEISELSEWADSLIEGGGGGEASEEPVEPMVSEEESLTSNNPGGIPESEMSGGIDAILAQHPEAVEHFKQGGDMDYDLESDLWEYYFNQGDIKNYDADASEFIGQQLADYLGVNEGILDTLKKVGGKVIDTLGHGDDDELLKDLQKKAGIPAHAQHGKPNMAKSNDEVDESETHTTRGGTVSHKDGVTKHQSGPGVYGGHDDTIHPDSPEEKHVNSPGAKTGHNTDQIKKFKFTEMDKSQTPPGRDGGDSDASKKQIHLGPESMMKAKELAKKGIDILSKSYKDADNKKDMKEGEGNFAKAIENLHGWYQHDSSDPDVEIFDFDDGEGGYYAQGTIEHNLKTGEINVEFEDTSGEYGGGSIKEKFNSIGDAMNVLRGITSQMRYNSGRKPNFDTLGGTKLAGPDDLYKTDKAGKKGTLTKARMDRMKMSSPYSMRGGPKGVLPEGQEDLDTIRRLLGK